MDDICKCLGGGAAGCVMKLFSEGFIRVLILLGIWGNKNRRWRWRRLPSPPQQQETRTTADTAVPIVVIGLGGRICWLLLVVGWRSMEEDADAEVREECP